MKPTRTFAPMSYNVPPQQRPAVYEARGFGYPVAEPEKTLERRITRVELIAKMLGRHGFGYRDQLSTFLAKFQPGDEIWYYDSMKHGFLSGAAGYYLIRNGNVIGDITLMVS